MFQSFVLIIFLNTSYVHYLLTSPLYSLSFFVTFDQEVFSFSVKKFHNSIMLFYTHIPIRKQRKKVCALKKYLLKYYSCSIIKSTQFNNNRDKVISPRLHLAISQLTFVERAKNWTTKFIIAGPLIFYKYILTSVSQVNRFSAIKRPIYLP